MCALLIRLGCLLSLLTTSSASAVTIDWVPIGNPGNASDYQPSTHPGPEYFGDVAYVYQIAKYEVTNAQYAEFLNAKAASDPFALYDPNMGSGYGGITQSGISGSYTYSVIPGRSDMPVNFVSFYDTLRFANWLNSGQGNADTETGAYTLLGGTPTPSNGTSVTRNAAAVIFLPSEDEWYKAAYYDASSGSYFDFPASSDGQTTCTTPTASPNSANCANAAGDLTNVGSYPGSPSPYGTFDQGGNVFEWNEEGGTSGTSRGVRGGGFSSIVATLAASGRQVGNPGTQVNFAGFRVASAIPEPGTGLLVIAGLVGLAGWRRVGAA